MKCSIKVHWNVHYTGKETGENVVRYVCKQRCKYVRQSNWDCTWQQSVIQSSTMVIGVRQEGSHELPLPPVPHTTHRNVDGRKGPVHGVHRAPQPRRLHRGRAAVRLLKAHRYRYRWRLERRRRRRSQTGSSRRTEHAPPNCGSRHTKTGFAYTRHCQSVAGCRLWSVHRSADLLAPWRDVTTQSSLSVLVVRCRETWIGLDGPPIYGDANLCSFLPYVFMLTTMHTVITKTRLCHTWCSILFPFPNFPVPLFPVSHFQRPAIENAGVENAGLELSAQKCRGEKFGVLVAPRELIIMFNLCNKIFRGSRSTGGQNPQFPIDISPQ